MPYTPTRESLSAHRIPDWFHDAKFGIFIHWGLYSVPAWAPLEANIQDLIKQGGLGALMKANPYAEWYMNSMMIPEHPTHAHHRETYGADSSYFDFQKSFEEQAAKMDAGSWADLFRDAGARYVVMVTKHHDGYLLWPSKNPNPLRDGYQSKRDFVGEVTEAVRGRGMKMGHYYSGVFDWSFKPGPITDFMSFLTNQGQSGKYVEYATAHWMEIIERYGTSVLWNDIGYPHGYSVNELFAHYYNTIEDGVINDRWNQTKIPTGSVGRALMKFMLDRAMKKMKRGTFEIAPKSHFDFRTPEYAVYPDIREEKWESCRGIGHSFGLNALEPESAMLTGDELIWMLADSVSKNGNLLLNVGPAADGTIPEMQRKPLLELGTWMRVNGDAIYGTRPWDRAEGELADGTPVRFTAKGRKVFFIIKSVPAGDRIVMKNFRFKVGGVARFIGTPGRAAWTAEASDTALEVPSAVPRGSAAVIEYNP